MQVASNACGGTRYLACHERYSFEIRLGYTQRQPVGSLQIEALHDVERCLVAVFLVAHVLGGVAKPSTVRVRNMRERFRIRSADLTLRAAHWDGGADRQWCIIDSDIISLSLSLGMVVQIVDPESGS